MNIHLLKYTSSLPENKMTDQTCEFVNQIRQFIEDIQDRYEDDLSTDDENEPGELTDDDDDDFVFVFKTLQGKQHSKHSLDTQIYQQILKYEGYQFLDVYNSNALYLCKKNEIKTKVTAHMKQTNAYSLIDELSETNPTCVQQHLDMIVKQVTILLNDLVTSHCINDSQFRQMNVERSKVRMDYLFFLPDLHQVSRFFLFFFLFVLYFIPI